MRGMATEGEVRQWRLERLKVHLAQYPAEAIRPSARKCAICGGKAGWVVVWEEARRTSFVTFFCQGCKEKAETKTHDQRNTTDARESRPGG